MSIGEVVLLGFLILAIVMIIALSPKSKNCKINTKFNTDGFDVSFETNEKSTPSNQR
jgi:hypothetical protein